MQFSFEAALRCMEPPEETGQCLVDRHPMVAFACYLTMLISLIASLETTESQMYGLLFNTNQFPEACSFQSWLRHFNEATDVATEKSVLAEGLLLVDPLLVPC